MQSRKQVSSKMENQRAALRRQGCSRPFPTERAEATDVDAIASATRRSRIRQRVSRHRLKRRLDDERAAEMSFEQCMYNGGATLSRRALMCKISRVIEVLQSELTSCPNPTSRSELFDILWSHPSVKHNLPEFYLPPKEAKAQMEVIANLQRELDAVKGVQSSDKLVVRGALLSAAVSTNVSDFRAIAKVLKTSATNVKTLITGVVFSRIWGRPCGQHLGGGNGRTSSAKKCLTSSLTGGT